MSEMMNPTNLYRRNPMNDIRMLNSLKRRVLCFTVCALTVATAMISGCSSLDIQQPDLSALKPAGPAAKAIAAWEPAVKHDGDQPAQRGFGGRVYFYDAAAKKPIKVKGNVVVYAYDEEGRKADDSVPTRSFMFDAKDLKRYYSKSKLGHSYNFWVPWDSQGPDGKAKKISLIVRYIPEKGSSVVSSQVAAYLPGKMNQNEMMAKTEWEQRQGASPMLPEGIRQVSYSEQKPMGQNVNGQGPLLEERLIESNENRPQAMQTATINLPTK